MPEVMAERRAAPRYSLVLAAEITELASGARLSARTSDVSLSGCYIDTLNPSPAGSSIRIALRTSNETLEIAGKVVYISPGLGMGVRFETPIPPDRLAILERWLQSASRSSY